MWDTKQTLQKTMQMKTNVVTELMVFLVCVDMSGRPHMANIH